MPGKLARFLLFFDRFSPYSRAWPGLVQKHPFSSTRFTLDYIGKEQHGRIVRGFEGLFVLPNHCRSKITAQITLLISVPFRSGGMYRSSTWQDVGEGMLREH